MKVYKHNKYDYVNIVEIPKNEIKKVDFAMCKQPKEKLKSFYDRQDDKPDVLCNAGFFATSTGDTIFNVVDDEVVYSKNAKYKWGIGITKEHKDIMYGSIASEYYGFVDFISGYPNLVDNGKSCAPWTFATEINYKALRTMIGYNKNTIFVVTVDKPGMAFTAMANLMIDIGCEFAVNLDGGGSSRCLVGGSVVNTPTEDRAVDSVFCVYLTDDARRSFYNTDDDKDYYIYTVVKGDSWWKISTNELGNGSLYTKLQEYNNWDNNKALAIGAEIKIPKNKFQEDKENSNISEEVNEDTNNSNQIIIESDKSAVEVSEGEKEILTLKFYIKGKNLIIKDANDKVLNTINNYYK